MSHREPLYIKRDLDRALDALEERAASSCSEPMDGGLVMATARNVMGRTECLVRIRLRVNTNIGPAETTYSCKMVLLPPLPTVIRGVDGWPKHADVAVPEKDSALKQGNGEDVRW
jgi:hypothetical protein